MSNSSNELKKLSKLVGSMSFSIFYTQKLRRKNFIRDVPQLITRKEIHSS